MDEKSAPLTKPDYRLWLSYFCTPFLFVLFSSFVLFVARKRMGVMDWSQFLGQIQADWGGWLIVFLVLLIQPIILLLCAHAELDAKCKPSIKKITKLLCNSFPLLPRLWIYISSKRIDLLICAALGVFFALALADALSYEGIFFSTNLANEPLLSLKSDYWLLLYGLLLPPAMGVLHLWDSAIEKIKRCNRLGADNASHIQGDAPIEPNDDLDLFEWRAKAKGFSNAVVAAPDGVVFGVEAPWGTGKTSFINLCTLGWQKPHIVYRFELLKFAGNPDLIQQFVLGLLNELEQHYYLPELRGAMLGYLAGLQGALELSGGPIKLTLNNRPNSIEEALEQINAQLERRLPEAVRMIVVIDDLDRVAPENVRDLLFALHKCFDLPRLRYVLCYDQQQLGLKAGLHSQHGGDLASQTLYEFIDKFVAVRVYLHPTYQGLEDYVVRKLLPGLQIKLDLSDKWRDLVKEVLVDGALVLLHEVDFSNRQKVLQSVQDNKPPRLEQNHAYWSLLGNIRQLKWLYNQMCLCWQKGLDLGKCEFNARDLAYLLLLQQSFPDLFRRLRAQAQSGEYLVLCGKKISQEPAPGDIDQLEKFIQVEQLPYSNNPWAQSKIEALLRGLFDKAISLKKTTKTSKPEYRAADDYRLIAYFNLLLQEKIPALHSSHAYLVWIQIQWKDEGKTLNDLLSEDIVKPHIDRTENWQDEHEYALWRQLFGGLPRYEEPQVEELLTEYLKALPRFESRDTLTPRRCAMARLFGEALRNLLFSDKGPPLAKSLLLMAWSDTEHGISNQAKQVNSLLGWQDAILVCGELHIKGLDEPFRLWLQQEFWSQFASSYPKHAVFSQEQLQALSVLVQGSREGPESQDGRPNAREWLVKHWKQLYDFSWMGPDSDLRKENSLELERWLFDSCWGSPSPTDEHLGWWLDCVLYNNSTSSDKNSYDPPQKSFNSCLKSYAAQHAKVIERVLQKRSQSDGGTQQLDDALDKLCGQQWSTFVESPPGA